MEHLEKIVIKNADTVWKRAIVILLMEVALKDAHTDTKEINATIVCAFKIIKCRQQLRTQQNIYMFMHMDNS